MFKILMKVSHLCGFELMSDDVFSNAEVACFKAQNNLSYDVHKNAWYDRDEFCAQDNFEYQFINLNM